MRAFVAVAMAAGLAVWMGTNAWAEDEAGQNPGKAGDRGRHLGHRGERIAQMDADKDGKITFEEFKAFMESKMQERFKALDTNGDGVLTKDDRRQGAGEGRGQGKRRGHGKPAGAGETPVENAAGPAA
jgi:hypothetical protein